MELIQGISNGSFAFFFLAGGCYGLFLILAALTRAGGGKTPLARFNKLHFRTGLAYIVASAIYAYDFQQIHTFSIRFVTDFLVGLSLYFGIHYAIGANFFVLAQASVSTAIIAIAHAHGGQITKQQCASSYASGQGLDYIRQSRLARLQNLLGWVQIQDGRYSLTTAGRWMARLTKFMLRIWGLKQLGAEK